MHKHGERTVSVLYLSYLKWGAEDQRAANFEHLAIYNFEPYWAPIGHTILIPSDS